MKKTFAGSLLLALVAIAGCNQESTPGGPGATSSSPKKPVIGQAEETFTLNVPTLSTSIKQGETKSISIGLKRGKNFDEDVTLKFSDVPKGLAIEPAPAVIKHGETEAKLSLKAAEDAAVGDFTIKGTGRPARGSDALAEFTVSVKKK